MNVNNINSHYDLIRVCSVLVRPAEEDLDLDHSQWEDIHVVTGALKMFFRELPEPLFPFSSFQPFVEAISESTLRKYKMSPRLLDVTSQSTAR